MTLRQKSIEIRAAAPIIGSDGAAKRHVLNLALSGDRPILLQEAVAALLDIVLMIDAAMTAAWPRSAALRAYRRVGRTSRIAKPKHVISYLI